jgi:hypothetical protein
MSQTTASLITASAKPISPLRRRMIEDMTVRGFGEKTQSDYIRHVKNFTIFLGRSPDTAEGEDLRRFQLDQREQGVQPPTMNSTTAALLAKLKARGGFQGEDRREIVRVERMLRTFAAAEKHDA